VTPLRIGAVAAQLSISQDTLRYYEKIGLLPPILRSSNGIRDYREQDLSRLRFIRRAQQMDFSLQEIGMLLQLREEPNAARKEVRQLATDKRDAVSQRISALTHLHDELSLLLNLCHNAEEGCPILNGLEPSASPSD
jgi:DNA-binding transcriptional MerR regulator